MGERSQREAGRCKISLIWLHAAAVTPSPVGPCVLHRPTDTVPAQQPRSFHTDRLHPPYTHIHTHTHPHTLLTHPHTLFSHPYTHTLSHTHTHARARTQAQSPQEHRQETRGPRGSAHTPGTWSLWEQPRVPAELSCWTFHTMGATGTLEAP